MIRYKTRKEIYNTNVAGMLSRIGHDFTSLPDEAKKRTVDLEQFHSQYVNKKAIITLNGHGLPQGFHSTAIIRGVVTVKSNGSTEKTHPFYVKIPAPGHPEGTEHTRRCAEYIRREVEPFGLDDEDSGITPLSVAGPLDAYVISEGAGSSLEEILKTKPPLDPHLISAVANNLFGVSVATLEQEFGQVPGFDLKCIHITNPDKLMRKDKEYHGLSYKGILRLFNQAIAKYTTAINNLESMHKYVEEKRPLVADTEGKLDSILIRIAEERTRGKEAIKELKELMAKEQFSEEKLEEVPVMFLPTDLLEHAYDHLRIKELDSGKFRAYCIDNVLYEGESSAGTPLEIYERLHLAAELVQHLPQNMSNVAHFLGKVAQLVENEFLKPESPVKLWQDYTPTLRPLLTGWKSSFMYLTTVSRQCGEWKHSVDALPSPQPTGQASGIEHA